MAKATGEHHHTGLAEIVESAAAELDSTGRQLTSIAEVPQVVMVLDKSS